MVGYSVDVTLYFIVIVCVPSSFKRDNFKNRMTLVTPCYGSIKLCPVRFWEIQYMVVNQRFNDIFIYFRAKDIPLTPMKGPEGLGYFRERPKRVRSEASDV